MLEVVILGGELEGASVSHVFFLALTYIPWARTTEIKTSPQQSANSSTAEDLQNIFCTSTEMHALELQKWRQFGELAFGVSEALILEIAKRERLKGLESRKNEDGLPSSKQRKEGGFEHHKVLNLHSCKHGVRGLTIARDSEIKNQGRQRSDCHRQTSAKRKSLDINTPCGDTSNLHTCKQGVRGVTIARDSEKRKTKDGLPSSNKRKEEKLGHQHSLWGH
ncbi:hypothetical protein Bbelb_286890 [Branchiostoma belcheri]|nr:hypothetical protein Bbelb_286890 [Branchiostoma belcheri]